MKWIFHVISSILIVELGGVAMNEFEQNVQSKRNDAIDSGIGFIVSFIGFSAIFVVATIIDLVAR